MIPEYYGILTLREVRSNPCHHKIMTNYQKLLNLVAIMGLQKKGKNSDNQNDTELVKYHYIMINIAH